MEDVRVKVNGKWYTGVEGSGGALMKCEKCCFSSECHPIVDDLCYKLSYVYWEELYEPDIPRYADGL